MALPFRTSRRVPAVGRREDAVFEFSRRIVGAEGVGDVARALFAAVDELFDVEGMALLMVDDDDGERLRLVAISDGSGDLSPPVVVEIASDTSALSKVLRDREPHRVLDASGERLHHPAVRERLAPHESALYVPLQTGAGALGVLVAGTGANRRAFRHDEVEFIEKLATDAAVALERARFARQLREVGERELVVAHVARAVRESLEPDEVLSTAARELGEQADADTVRVVLRAGAARSGREATWSSGRVDVDSFDESTLPTAARLAIDDQRVVQARASGDGAAATMAVLPLVYREDVLGVIIIERRADALAQVELRLIELVAVEVAAALEYVSLHQVKKRHLDEQMALARAAQSLTADLRFDRVLEHIVDEVVKLLATPSAAFYVYDREFGTLTMSAAFGEAERRAVGDEVGLTGLAGRVVRSGVSQATNDYEADLGGDIHPAFRGVRRALAVPVRWQGDLRGVISVADRESARPITEHEIGLLEAFADLASLALHNAESFASNSRQARIQAGFYRISQVLSSSLSREATLAALAQAATEVLDGSWAVVVGSETAADELTVEGSWLAPQDVLASLHDPSSFVESTVSLALDLGRVVTSRSLADDERIGPRWRALMAGVDVYSQLAVPIHTHGRQSSAVVVCFDRSVRFGDEELVVANNLATAASAALERAGLFENERRTRRLSEVLADVSALLAETLRPQTVLDRIVAQAAVLLEVDACVLAIAGTSLVDAGSGPGREVDLHVHSAAGRDDRLVMVLEGSPVGGLVEEVARSQRSVTVAELASETSGQALEGERYDGFLGVPLRHPRGHLLGVLSACSRRRRAFSDAEIASLESFAASAAIAVRNAELYANIQRERERLQALLSSIGEGIVATDAEGRVTIWNRAAEELTSISTDKATGRQWRDVLGLNSETQVDEGQLVVEARPSGIPMYLSLTSSRLREGGDDAGWIHAFRDVSASHILDRLKSDFVSTVSYVLRTPLTSIYGFASTLLREDLEFPPEDRRVFLEYIAGETERLTQIVDDLLEVANIDAGSVDIQVGTFPVTPILTEAVRRARERGARRHVTVDDGGHLAVRADAEKLETVLANLVDNAVRFTPEGGDVRVRADGRDGVVRITVSDSGAGITPTEQKHLFTKFYVSPGATGTVGSGLGLYISRGLIDAMGGRIWVSSQVGEGSTFTVELPAAEENRTP